jgi:hypothetical protein
MLLLQKFSSHKMCKLDEWSGGRNEGMNAGKAEKNRRVEKWEKSE